ncbi:hypothetical protein GCM10009808_00280 [Microbacterium sediminicola]|uniref:CAAX prenyl protease 2/Lysostaphin resistance protein A-like domain-containing protein n=1 Tax=Microbacterium sediminicola TaxID=415210 RepID=A0ABN2HFR2_9MICO
MADSSATSVLSRGTGQSRRQRTETHTWRSGGSTVARWEWDLVGWAVVLLGAGILFATLAEQTIGGTTGSSVAMLALWGGMLAAIIVAFVRSRPRGLLRFHPLDLVYGLGFGILLRLTQGWLETATTGSAAWPSYATLDGALPANFWFDGVLVPVVGAPLLEEFFFHAVLLVAIYTAMRRRSGTRAWGWFVALVVTTLLFVGSHAAFATLPSYEIASLGLVGLVCGGLVLSTARIWGAVIAHVVYNGMWVAMAVVGTVAG